LVPTTSSRTTATNSRKIYNGQNWTPALTAPLTFARHQCTEGKYLLAVNGRELAWQPDNLNSFFEGTAGKQTVLRVGNKVDGSDARDVTVVSYRLGTWAAESGLD